MEKVRREKMQVREKVGKSRFIVFFQWFGAPEGRKVTSLKRRGAESAGQRRDEELHAVVARSTFQSQNVHNTPTSDHFWKLSCRKSAPCCGAKHISTSKCKKLRGSDHFWTFRCRKSARRLARNTLPSQKCKKLRGSDHFWTFRCRKGAQWLT